MKIGEAIKRMIKAKGLTQSELAERIGRKQTNVAMYIRSEEGIKLENLMKMAEACGYAVVIEDKSGSGERFVIGDGTEETEVAPRKEGTGEMFAEFEKWYTMREEFKKWCEQKEGGMGGQE